VKSTKGIYLLLGSNLGDRLQVLSDTQQAIGASVGRIESISSVYETEPWGIRNQPSFYNQVLEIDTEYQPHELLKQLQRIENQIGKVKLGKWRERLIDIDILYYHQEVIVDELLKLPHPQIQNRRFTLVPMCEVNPEFVHPVMGVPQKELLIKCEDQLKVWTLNPSLIE